MKTIGYCTLLVSLLAIAHVANAQTTTAPAVSTSAASTSATDSTALKSYVGSYTFSSGSPVQKFTVTTDKGELFGAADDYGKNKLLRQAKADTYLSTSSYGSTITFSRDATTQAVTGLTLTIQGTDLSAKRDTP